MLRITVIDVGLPGVTNQCLGVAQAIASCGHCEISIFPIRLRSKALQPLYRLALAGGAFANFSNRRFANAMARLFFSGIPASGLAPHVVVTSLGRGEMVAALFKAGERAFTIHLDVPVRMPSSSFDLVILLRDSVAKDLDCPTLTLDFNPTFVRFAVVGKQLEPGSAQVDRPLHWAFLVGGDGGGYAYKNQEWARLGRAIGELAGSSGAKLVLTTSRRTTRQAEQVLKANGITDTDSITPIWYGSQESDIVVNMLKQSDVVFCTEDSRSMISDAVASGRAVYTIRPRASDPEQRLKFMLERLESGRRIRRITIDDLPKLDVEQDLKTYFKPIAACWSHELVRFIEDNAPSVWSKLTAPHPISDPDRPELMTF